MDNLTDTLLNIVVFSFIGILIWLYCKDPSKDDGIDKNATDKGA